MGLLHAADFSPTTEYHRGPAHKGKGLGHRFVSRPSALPKGTRIIEYVGERCSTTRRIAAYKERYPRNDSHTVMFHR